MSELAQLSDFDEQLYQLSRKGPTDPLEGATGVMDGAVAFCPPNRLVVVKAPGNTCSLKCLLDVCCIICF